MAKKSLKTLSRIENSILLIRGQRVMIDVDLAKLYGVTTRRLNEQVKRNRERFPSDFMFQLTKDEKKELVANCDRFKNLKHSTALPHAFTEHGAIMLASVLNSPTAIDMSIFVVRAFIKLREIISSHRSIAQKLAQLERKVGNHDEQIKAIIVAIRELMSPSKIKPRKIGFHSK